MGSGYSTSMDAPLSEDENLSLYNIIKTFMSLKPDAVLFIDSLHYVLEVVLITLSERESEIIGLNYGIGNRKPTKAIDEIPELFVITRERDGQIE